MVSINIINIIKPQLYRKLICRLLKRGKIKGEVTGFQSRFKRSKELFSRHFLFGQCTNKFHNVLWKSIMPPTKWICH